MQNQESSPGPELRELLDIEVAEIVATANEQGFATKDILSGLAAAVADSMRALTEDPDPADDPDTSPGT
jgi:hypothetical protein